MREVWERTLEFFSNTNYIIDCKIRSRSQWYISKLPKCDSANSYILNSTHSHGLIGAEERAANTPNEWINK